MTNLSVMRENVNKYIDELEKQGVTAEQIIETADTSLNNIKLATAGAVEVLSDKEDLSKQDLLDILPVLVQEAIDCGVINDLANYAKGSPEGKEIEGEVKDD